MVEIDKGYPGHSTISVPYTLRIYTTILAYELICRLEALVGKLMTFETLKQTPITAADDYNIMIIIS